MVNIPRCMSTQHPDNVLSPFFAANSLLEGEDEIQEAYYVFSHLGCDEQMWDIEGKEVDGFVVKKLLTRYEAFFRDKRLGRDVFLTLRVPNPTVEKAEAKILLEALESIPRSFDAAKVFNGDEIAPIFEIILPMTASHRCLNRIYTYYRDFVVGKQTLAFPGEDVTIAQWIGEFKPARINVIPLFEDMPHMLNAHQIVREYVRDKPIEYQRVFLARSDPALNYGLISAVLMNKIALWRLYRLSGELGIPIYPIVGVGSAPFRGNLRPATVERVSREYPSVHTFTIQSSFKYDHPVEEVKKAIQRLRERPTETPQEVDEERSMRIIEKYVPAYQQQIVALAPLINCVAKHVPNRRKRKLHIGLFGYSRSLGGIALPRAIPFTAALYSIGLPPELLGLNALTQDDMEYVRGVYVNFDEDMRDALRYFNPDSRIVPGEILAAVKERMEEVQPDEEHREIVAQMVRALEDNETAYLGELVLAAANLRKFLG